MNKSLVKLPSETIEKSILFIRGERVILDADLAALYGVTTARLNEQVKRNQDRFPKDFAFRLKREEFENLMSQYATSRSEHGGSASFLSSSLNTAPSWPRTCSRTSGPLQRAFRLFVRSSDCGKC